MIGQSELIENAYHLQVRDLRGLVKSNESYINFMMFLEEDDWVLLMPAETEILQSLRRFDKAVTNRLMNKLVLDGKEYGHKQVIVKYDVDRNKII